MAAGPIASHERIPEEAIKSFQAALRDELVGRRVVAVFSRLHPLIAQQDLLAGLGEIAAVGMTVSVDLTLPLEDQWAGYSKKYRRIIRKAQEAGTICIEDRQHEYRREWVDIYQRRCAASGSLLPLRRGVLELLAAELGSVLHLFVALVDGKVAAAGLYTICDGIVQAHLGALRLEYAKLSQRDLRRHGARWAVEPVHGSSISGEAWAGTRLAVPARRLRRRHQY
jgi:hypothetical protein